MTAANSAPSKALTHVSRDPEKDLEQATRPLSLRLITRLLSFTRPYKLRMYWLLAIVVVRALQLPALAWCVAWIINNPIQQRNIYGRPFSEEGIGVVWSIAGFAALSIFAQYTFYWRLLLSRQVGEAVIHDLRQQMFAHLQTMPMSFFDRTKIGRVLSRFASDAENVRVGVQDVLFMTMVNGIQMFVAAGMMLAVDWQLFLLVACVGIVVWLINRKFRHRFARLHRAAQESMSRVTATLAESVSGIRVTQGFVRQDVNADLFHNLVEDHSNYNVDIHRANGLFNPLLMFNNQVFLAMLLIVGGWLVLDGEIYVAGMHYVAAERPPGRLIEFFFLANVFFAPVAAVGQQYTAALTAMAGAERVFTLLDNKPEWQDDDDAVELGPIEGRVEFKDLSFAYVPDRVVLRDINFVAKAGQTVALVGHTGSGKSSIINLISKFYLPTEGELLVDGRDIRKIKSESLHKQIGIVLQANFLFSGTVMENIKVGKQGASDDEVFEAARKLDCLDIIEALPNGLNTEVGERGGALSLGQRQLVCFTRAMLADPPILILDEATSSVDTMTEVRIQHALEALFKGRTTFVVAHRLSTIRHASTVLVLDHGRIVERGSHTELLATGGVYANLYRQFIHATES